MHSTTFQAQRAEAKTLDQLKQLARAKGYSIMWAIKVHQSRQNKQ